MTTPAIPDTSLADFFPRTTKLCVKPSAEFFKCLSEKSVKSTDADVEAGARGLSQCLKEKKIYETCMLKNDAKINDPKRHRVRKQISVYNSHTSNSSSITFYKRFKRSTGKAILEAAELDASETSLGYHSAYSFPTGCSASPSPLKTPKTHICE